MSGYKPSSVASGNYIEYPKWMYHVEFPPQLVQSEEERASLGEDWYEASRTRVEQCVVLPHGADFIVFPKWKYHFDGRSMIVNSESDENELEKNEWFDTPALAKLAARSEQHDEKSELDGMTREELGDIATALGIGVKGTWGARRLIQAIEEEKTRTQNHVS